MPIAYFPHPPGVQFWAFEEMFGKLRRKKSNWLKQPQIKPLSAFLLVKKLKVLIVHWHMTFGLWKRTILSHQTESLGGRILCVAVKWETAPSHPISYRRSTDPDDWQWRWWIHDWLGRQLLRGVKPNVINVLMGMPMLPTEREVMATTSKIYHHWNFPLITINFGE